MNLENELLYSRVSAVWEVLKPHTTWVMVVILVIAIIICLRGYKLCEFLVGIIAFMVFGEIATVVAKNYTDVIYIYLIAFLVAGTIGTLLAVKLYLIGAFLLSFFIGCGIGLNICKLLDNKSAWIILGCGIILGLLGIFLTKHILIISTSMIGGILSGYTITNLLELKAFYTIGIGIVFSIIGMVLQYKIEKMNPKREKRHKAEKYKEVIPTSEIEHEVDTLREEGTQILKEATPKKTE
ncbi:TM7S3/TM198-like domain-containing protein [Lachnospiraceae bacterium LCP25S3_G4]